MTIRDAAGEVAIGNKIDEFCGKIDEFCGKIDEFCIENDELNENIQVIVQGFRAKWLSEHDDNNDLPGTSFADLSSAGM